MSEALAGTETHNAIGYFMKPHHVKYQNAFHFLYGLRLYSEVEQRRRIATHVQDDIDNPNPEYTAFGGIKDLIGETAQERAQFEQGLFDLVHLLHKLDDKTTIHIRADAKDLLCLLAINGGHCRRYQTDKYELAGENGIAENLYGGLKRFGPVKRR